VLTRRPHALVIIDSPAFTLQPAARAADIVLGHLRRGGGAMAARNANG